MQHSAQQRSATHTAEHTRAQEHTGSTAAHSSARPHAHIAHSAAKHGCRLQHNTIAATEHAHINLLSWVCFPFIPLPPQRTAQQGRPAHSKASLKAWPTNKSHSTAMQHSAQQRSATHSTMSTEHTRARCFARTAQPYSGILHVPVMFIMALQLGICLRGSYVSSRMGQLKTSMIRRRSKESIDR